MSLSTADALVEILVDELGQRRSAVAVLARFAFVVRISRGSSAHDVATALFDDDGARAVRGELVPPGFAHVSVSGPEAAVRTYFAHPASARRDAITLEGALDVLEAIASCLSAGGSVLDARLSR